MNTLFLRMIDLDEQKSVISGCLPVASIPLFVHQFFSSYAISFISTINIFLI